MVAVLMLLLVVVVVILVALASEGRESGGIDDVIRRVS